MWLNPQSWAVISGMADRKQAELAMENVYQRLNTEYGAVLMDPPYHAHAFDGALAVIYNAGVKENGGVFSQSQGWLILAEALLGHGDRAFAYFCEMPPPCRMTGRKYAGSNRIVTDSLQREKAVPMPVVPMYTG